MADLRGGGYGASEIQGRVRSYIKQFVEEFSAVISLTLAVISVIVAITAAFFSYRAYHVTHADAISDRLFDSLGDLLTAITRIEISVEELARSGDDEAKAREQVLPGFVMLREAVSRVNLARAQNRCKSREDTTGDWILDAANNLAASLLQADGEAAKWREAAGNKDDLYDDRIGTFSDEQWETLVRSSSFYTVYCLTKDLPQPDDPRFPPVNQWWGQLVGDSAALRTVYSPNTDYLNQHARLLSDFGQVYIAPWAEDLVASPQRRNGRAWAKIT
jgi:hypothetical protein